MGLCFSQYKDTQEHRTYDSSSAAVSNSILYFCRFFSLQLLHLWKASVFSGICWHNRKTDRFVWSQIRAISFVPEIKTRISFEFGFIKLDDQFCYSFHTLFNLCLCLKFDKTTSVHGVPLELPAESASHGPRWTKSSQTTQFLEDLVLRGFGSPDFPVESVFH